MHPHFVKPMWEGSLLPTVTFHEEMVQGNSMLKTSTLVHSSKFTLHFLTNKNRDFKTWPRYSIELSLPTKNTAKQTKTTKNLWKLDMFKNTKTSDSMEQQIQQAGLEWLYSMGDWDTIIMHFLHHWLFLENTDKVFEQNSKRNDIHIGWGGRVYI